MLPFFKKTSGKFGFTLVEILVTISLILIISWFGVAYYSSFNQRQNVEQAAKKIVSDLRLAQNMATSQEIPSGCLNFEGYFFNVDLNAATYKIESICNPVSTRSIHKEVVLNGVTLSGFTMVKFKSLGKLPEFVNEKKFMTVTGSNNYSRTITVGDSGEISIN